MKKEEIYQSFLPHSSTISAESYQAMIHPPFSHRSSQFENLYQNLQKNLQKLTKTKLPFFFLPSSARGSLEGLTRNLNKGKILHLINGAFSQQWAEISQRNQLACEILEFPWHTPICPQAVKEKIQAKNFDCIALVHSETSTGILNPLSEIAQIVRQYSNALLLVDAVSSFGATSLPKEDIYPDILLASTQKALALPAGLTLFSLSEKALARCNQNSYQEFYFCLDEIKKAHQKNQTHITPPINLLLGLQYQLEKILHQEGIKERYQRHCENQKQIITWAENQKIPIYAPPKFRSPTLTTLNSKNLFDSNKITKRMKEKGFLIDNGYGILKNKTLRLAHMGETTQKQIKTLLLNLETCL